jgi:hypothetical protein
VKNLKSKDRENLHKVLSIESKSQPVVVLHSPPLGRWRQEACEFEATLDYIWRNCLQKKKKKTKREKEEVACLLAFTV